MDQPCVMGIDIAPQVACVFVCRCLTMRRSVEAVLLVFIIIPSAQVCVLLCVTLYVIVCVSLCEILCE